MSPYTPSVFITTLLCRLWRRPAPAHHSRLAWLPTLTHAPRIGDAAKNAFATNPENTVFDAKRLIGRKIDDPEIKKDMKHWPFKVIEKNGKPYIRVKHRGDNKEFVRPFS